MGISERPTRTFAENAGRIFISYRRYDLLEVEKVCRLLESVGLEVWLDRQSIDVLEDFPQEIRKGLEDSHAALVWWSVSYNDSDICMQEFRLAWQHSRRRSEDVGKRLWIINPEPSAHHIVAGELNSFQFLAPPAPNQEVEWADDLRKRIDALVPEGRFSSEASGKLQPLPKRFGRPTSQRPLSGRAMELVRIHSALHPPQLKAAGNIGVQLHGIAGIGKTATAAAYSDEFAFAYPAGVWWFNLSNWTVADAVTIEDAGVALLAAIDMSLRDYHPGLLANLTRDDDHTLLTAPEVRERLARKLADDGKPFLWILDDFPLLSPVSFRDEVVAFLRAPGLLGRTLITTQDSRELARCEPIRLEPLTVREATQLLGRFVPTATRVSQSSAISELAESVGFHTLALVLLGEYAQDAEDGYTTVLQQVHQQGALDRVERIHEILRDELGELGPSVVATFQISVERLTSAAKHLIALASVCATNTPIPTALLQQSYSGLGDSDTFAVAARTLVRFSLLAECSDDGRAFSIHPLLAAAVIRRLDREPLAERKAFAETLLKRFARLEDDSATFVLLRYDVAHAHTLLHHLAGRMASNLMLALCRFYLASGSASMALQMARRAESLGASELGPMDRETLSARALLATAMAGCGNLEGASLIQETLLPLMRESLGPNDRETLSLWSQLAETRLQQHRLAEAEQLQRGLLDVLVRIHGEKHLDTLDVITSLSATLYAKGESDYAQKLLERVAALVADLGQQHTIRGLAATNNLALMLIAQGQFAQAQRLQTEVVQGIEAVVGKDHPDAVIAKTTLADALFEQKEFVAADELYSQALDALRRLQGLDHPATLLATSRSICAKYALGKDAAALDLQVRFVDALRPMLPAGHPDALTALDVMLDAVYVSEEGDLTGFIPLIEQALDARLRQFGEEHRDTIRTRINLAVALFEAGFLHRARDLFDQALPAAMVVIGDSHPETARLMHRLADCLLALGDQSAHDDMQRRATTVLRRFAASQLGH